MPQWYWANWPSQAGCRDESVDVPHPYTADELHCFSGPAKRHAHETSVFGTCSQTGKWGFEAIAAAKPAVVRAEASPDQVRSSLPRKHQVHSPGKHASCSSFLRLLAAGSICSTMRFSRTQTPAV